MIPRTPEEILAYWAAVGVECFVVDCEDTCGRTEFSALMRAVGLPIQSWWLFRFGAPPIRAGVDCVFGSMGNEALRWRERDGACIVTDDQGLEHRANRSFLAFLQCLTIFDQGYRKIRLECPGDTGEDWEKGDAIIAAMEGELRAVDPDAFANEEDLWPFLLVEING